MTFPTWATIVGVFMLLLGGCGAYKNISKINMPATLEQSSEILDVFSEEMERSLIEDKAFGEALNDNKGLIDSLEVSNKTEVSQDSTSREVIGKIFRSFDKMLVFTDYYKKWIVRLGIIGCIISLVYFLAGLFLIMGKSFSIKFTYSALGLSTAFMIFQIVVMSLDNEGGMISKWSTSFGSYFMIFTNVVLLLIVATANKEYFYQHEMIKE